MSVKISVIIPFFNGEKYLEECVDSVTGQTMKELEIILVDDGSTDGSASIAKRLALNDDRVKFIAQENKGVSTARNVAMETATGECFMFVDADDRLKKDACEVLYNALRENECEIVTGGYVSFKGDAYSAESFRGNAQQILYDASDIKNLAESMGKNNFFRYAWRRLFSAKLIRENGIIFHPDIAIGEDTLFCLDCFLRAEKSLFLPVTVYEYRQNTQGVMRSQKYNKKMTTSLLLQYEEKKRLCKEFLKDREQEFLSDAAYFSYDSGCRLLFDNLFHKGDGNFKEFRKIVKSEMIRDMFRYFDINKDRSKSLDWVALKFISLRMIFIGYCIQKIRYK